MKTDMNSGGDEALKVHLFVRNIVHFRYLGETAHRLCEAGHYVTLFVEDSFKPNTTDRFIRAWLDRYQNAALKHIGPPQRRSPFFWTKIALRDFASYAAYFQPQHPTKDLAYRVAYHFPYNLRRVFKYLPFTRRLFEKPGLRPVFHALERCLPAEKTFLTQLKEESPDVVIATPFIMERMIQTEYVKAARKLKIPTIVHVLSWDNLTTKGTFGQMPDYLFVWNQPLVREAVELHHMPAEMILTTGAPTFDFWFHMKPTKTREEYCAMVGADPGRVLITYLGSSRGIARDESNYALELSDILARHPATQNVQLVIRPHPLNAETWQDFEAANCVVWPRAGDWPDDDNAKQEYFDTLYHSEAVIGVNTSAFLDAAILDKPCVTALTPHYQHSQEGRGHFQHLINADFLETARSFEELADILGAIVAGRDAKAENRRRFVREFIRPHGIENDVADILSRTIQLVAQRKSVTEIEHILASEYSEDSPQPSHTVAG